MRKSSLLALVTACILPSVIGCHATRPDVPGQAAAATGITNAIVFHTHGEPVDNPPLVSDTLTIHEVVRLALAHDARIQSAIARVRAAEADANQARLIPNPVLGIDVRYPRGGGVGQVFEASLSEDLIQILQKPAQIQAADNRLRAAAADALTVVLDVMAEAQSTYISSLEVDSEIKAAEAREAGLRHIRDIAQLRQTAGDASRLDVITLDSQLAQASLDAMDIRLRQTELRLTLARLIGRPRFNGTLVLAAPEATDWNTTDETAWLEAGLRHRPELQSKIWELRALGEEVSLAALSPLQGTSIGAHAEHDPQWRLGPTLSVPVPLFDWGQEARAKAEAQRIAARHDLVEQQRQLIQEIRLAYATVVQTSASLTQTRTTLLPLQRAQLDQAQLSYKLGEADLSATLMAETDYRAAILRIAKLEESAALARIRLERAAGGAAIASTLTTTAPTSAPSTSPTTKEVLP